MKKNEGVGMKEETHKWKSLIKSLRVKSEEVELNAITLALIGLPTEVKFETNYTLLSTISLN